MRPITFTSFLGANQAFDPTLLPESVGVESLNQRPGFGDLRPWRAPGASVASVPASPARKSIYRMASGYWLSWGSVVDATIGFDVDDTTERTYITGMAGGPKWTNNIIGLTGGPPYPQATRELAVPTPTTALTAAINTDGTGTAAARSYVYTWVNDLGWESAPSPASNVLLVMPGGTVDLSGFDTPPAGNYGFSLVRLYELVTGTSGTSEWFFLREWSLGSTPANPIDDARAVGAAALATEGYRVPPADGHSIKKLWNGMLSMLSGNSMRICEPYKPYAYPLAYEIGLGALGVAQAVVGQRVLVLTDADARIVSGSSPLMDDEAANINQPCSSKLAVVEFNEGFESKGAVWPSPSGLCWWGESTGFVRLTEDKLLTKDQWAALNPDTMVAGRAGRFYVCFYDDGTAWKGFAIDPRDPQGIYFLSTGYEAAYTDPVTGELYVYAAGEIMKWDAGASMTATFKTKEVESPSDINIGAIKVVAKGWPVTVKMWADGTLRHTQTITAGETVRPPKGWMAKRFQFEIASAQRVIALRAARTVDDLRQP